jgi:hypothetical protein
LGGFCAASVLKTETGKQMNAKINKADKRMKTENSFFIKLNFGS